MSAEHILSRLRNADRLWGRRVATERLLGLVKWGLGAIVLVAVVDLIAQLGSGARLILGLALGAAALCVFVRFVYRAWVKEGPLLRIATLLESRDPTLGSKLVNVLQLREQADDPERAEITRQLARSAVDSASAELEKHHFADFLKSPTLRATFLVACAAAVVFAALVLSFRSVAVRQAQRFLDPFGDHPPFSFTQLRIVSPAEDGEQVIFRKALAVEAEFSGHRPSELVLLVADAARPEATTEIPMMPQDGNRFFQQIEEVGSDLLVRVATTDGRSRSEARRIAVVLTPQLEKTSLTITPPSYTKQSARETAPGIGKGAPPAVTVLAGSRLDFTLTSNRPLGTGSVACKGSAPESLSVPLEPVEGEATNAAHASLSAEESGRLTFDLRDVSGLAADKELAAALTVTHDLPPEIAIAEPESDGFIVDTFAAKLAVQARDDYGIRVTRLHAGVNGKFGEPTVIEAQTDPPQRDALEALEVRPVDLGAKPGDILSFFADTTDIRPEPQIARTRTLRLEVITEDQYNDLLRAESEIADLQEKYARLYDSLDALSREQRALAEDAAKAAAAETDDPAQQEKRDARQDDLNERIEKLAEEMATATRDKPLYDLEESLQEVLDNQAAALRDSVAQNRNDRGENATPGAFAEAAKDQADRLAPEGDDGREEIAEALAEAQKMQEMLKSLAAWDAAYREQQDLASQTEALRDRKELTREDQLALQDMAARERAIGETLGEIARQLREQADAAEDAFPEAAEDARSFANAMEKAGLEGMADRASRSMLAGRNVDSHDRAENLRAEMEKLVPEGGNCRSGMGSEFAQRLSLARSMLAGDTFGQMAMCRKFGFGQGKMGMGGGTGLAGGRATGTMPGAPMQSLLGGESHLGQRESATASRGKAQGAQAPEAALAHDNSRSDSEGMNVLNRPSASATVDSAAEEYREIVDAYFRKLTLPATPSP